MFAAATLVALAVAQVSTPSARPGSDGAEPAVAAKKHKDHVKPKPVAEFGDDLRAELERLRKFEREHLSFIGEKDHKIAQLRFDLDQLAKVNTEQTTALWNKGLEIDRLKQAVRDCVTLSDRETARLVQLIDEKDREIATLRKQLAAAQAQRPAAPPVVDGWLESPVYPGVQFYGHQAENGDIVYSFYRYVNQCSATTRCQ